MAMPSEVLAQISDLLLTHFGNRETILSVDPVGEGANARGHFVVNAASGNHYGLKLPVRGVPFGLEKEHLMATLACTLDAPNACPVAQTDRLDFIDLFRGKTVNVTHWLAGSKQVRQLSEEERRLVRSGPDSTVFRNQAGEWMAFGLLFGIGDRHPGNWVWAPAEKKLAMIDMEQSLEQGELAHYTWLLDYVERENARTLKLKSAEIRDLYDGYSQMLAKHAAQKSMVEGLLEANDFSKGFKSAYAERAPEEVLSNFLLALG